MTGALTNSHRLSIIVPILNEINLISTFIKNLHNALEHPQEIIFVDGGSTDGTWEWLQKQDLKNAYKTDAGRAHQMNFGASKARYTWLYFVHIDSTLPQNFDTVIIEQMRKGHTAGCFQLQFDTSNRILKSAAAGSKWNHLLCRGGDQTLFVTRELFNQIKGFDTQYKVCEDIQFIKQLYKKTSFIILPYFVITSSRRFYENGVTRLLFHFGVIHFMHWIGLKPRLLHKYYQQNIR